VRVRSGSPKAEDVQDAQLAQVRDAVADVAERLAETNRRLRYSELCGDRVGRRSKGRCNLLKGHADRCVHVSE